MTRRHPALPRLWLTTDERQGDDLWRAVRRLPRGAGIIFRHHATPIPDRRRLFARLKRLARGCGLLLLVAGNDRTLRADGSHHRRPGPSRFGTAPAHDIAEVRAAERSGAAAVLLSPVFPTRSHPGSSAMGLLRFAALARATRLPVISLGGMTHRRGCQTAQVGAFGWAAIDAWTSESPTRTR